MKRAQLLGLWGPWQRKVFRDTDCLRHGVTALSESFAQPLVVVNQKASLAGLSVAPPIQALRRLPGLVSSSVVRCVRHIEVSPWLGSCSVVLHTT